LPESQKSSQKILGDAPSRIFTSNLIRAFAPSSGNICDRRLWRIKGASVGAAVDFVRRSKPHKQNRAPQEGKAVIFEK